MNTQIFINSIFKETRIAVVEDKNLSEIYVERTTHPNLVGNVYKGLVGKVVPGMQAAFVDIGLEKSGFISVEDVYEESIIEQFLEEKEINKRNTQQLIQDILKEGQYVIVQAIKEPVSGKGTKLTYIGIPGNYLVLLGTVDIVGISKKIEDEAERARLQEIIKKHKPADIGFIARTSCLGIEPKDIKEEIKLLSKVWSRIKKKFETSKKPSLIYQEPKIYIKIIRELINKNNIDIIVDSEKVYKEIKKTYSNSIKNKKLTLEHYQDSEPIFEKYNLESKIKKIYQKKVWLKSGGHLIIDEAEDLQL